MAKNTQKREDALAAIGDTVTEDDENGSSPKTNSDGSSMVYVNPSAAKLAQASTKEQMAELESFLGIEASEIEVIAGGSLPYWPAMAGLMIAGTIESTRTVPTRWITASNPTGAVTLYTMTLGKTALAQTLDGEVFELQPGEQITILERSVLKDLAMRIGQKVAILCAGKKMGKKGFSFWDYRIIGQRRTSEQIQAAATMAMASLQHRVLLPPQKSAS